MNIGIATSMKNEYITVKEQFELFERFGVQHTFLSAGHPRLEEALELLPRHGIICDNFHSDFRGTLDGEAISMHDIPREGKAGDRMLELLLENVTNCQKYGIDVLVVHSVPEPPDVALNAISDARYRVLADYARECNVTLAFENIYYYQNLARIMDIIPDGKFCWDCGHQYCFGDRRKVMPDFADRLIALHVHDNNFEKDEHAIPFEGRIDFDVIAKELADCRFDGTMMLELAYRGQIPPEDYYAKAAKAAKKLVCMVKSCQSAPLRA